MLGLVLAAMPVGPAPAFWHPDGSGAGAASTGTLAPPTDVSTVSSVTGVSVAWTPSTSPVPVAYIVTRTGASGDTDACGTGAAPTADAACIDTGVPAGAYTYLVTATQHTWTAISAPSGSVVVAHTVLGPAASFSVLGSTTVASTGDTTLSGDLGVSPSGTVSGFPPGIVGGDIHLADQLAADARSALVVAYDEADNRVPDTEFAGDLNGAVFTPGVHHTGAAMALTGSMTLDALGDPEAVFVFQVDAALNAAADSRVLLTGGARAENVYWQVLGAATIGADAIFAGTIMTPAAIVFGLDAELLGRALALGSVTMSGNAIRFTIAPPPSVTITGGATRVTKDTTPSIEGITDAAPGSAVTVTVGGRATSTTVQVGGTWSTVADELAAGVYVVEVRVRDAAGNNGIAAQQLTVEVSPAPIGLGESATYSVLSGSNVVGTGSSALDGDLGVSPGTSMTGFPPGTVGGAIHLGDDEAALAIASLEAALADGASRVGHTQFSGDLNGRVFHTGVHDTSAAMSLTGTVTLDAEGDPDAVFVFRMPAAMDTAAGSVVSLTGGAQASNVYWIVDGAATLGGASSFEGTILARGAITIGALTRITGRALSLATVTLDGATID